MNRISLLLICLISISTTSMGQNNAFEKEWKAFKEAVEKGTPKTALSIAEGIENAARSEQDRDQIVKAIWHQSQMKVNLEEEFLSKDFARLEEKYMTEKDPVVKALFAHLLGLRTKEYLNQNRYRINNRSSYADPKSTAINEMSIEQLQNLSNSYFLKTIENKSALRSYTFKEIEDILNLDKVKMGNEDLYLILAMETVRHFKNTNNTVTIPSNEFTINQEEVFGENQDFIDLNFESRDTNNFKYLTIRLLQELTKDYGNSDSRLKISLERLNFVRSHAIVSNKDSRYESALRELDSKFENHSDNGLVKKSLLAYNMSKSNFHDTHSEWTAIRKEAAFDAKNLGLELVKHPDKSLSDLAKQALSIIEGKSVSFQTEKIVPIGKASLMLLNYRNFSKVHFHLYKVEAKARERFSNQLRDQNFDGLKKFNKIKSWSEDLPASADHTSHSIELVVPVLKTGNYILVASEKSELSSDQQINQSFFQVSDLAFQFFSHEGENEVVVVDRNSGEAVKGATVSIYKRDYNNRTREASLVLRSEHLTDKNGVVKFPTKHNDRHNITLKITKGKDRLDGLDSYLYQSNKQKKNEVKRSMVFTDRSIYRPGQTVHFKGIAYVSNELGIPSTGKPNKITLSFFDANQQVIEKSTLPVDEFGSFSGTFIIPKGGLNGNFAISVAAYNSYHSIRVEEYKRPKFKVVFEDSKDEYKIGDLVALSFMADSYAGVPITSAKVNYRVYRQAYWPWYRMNFYCGYRPYPNFQKTLVGTGQTMTDDSGKGAVSFSALGDPYELQDGFSPSYFFSVELDVMDLDGETQSSVKQYSFSAKPYQISLEHNEYLAQGEDFEFSTKLINFDQQELSKEIEVRLHKTNANQYDFRTKLWSFPEFHSLTKAEYQRTFPYDLYSQKDHPYGNTEGAEVTRLNKEGKLVSGSEINKLKQGIYFVEIFVDGIKSDHISYVNIYQENISGKKGLSLIKTKESLKPGDQANISFLTKSKEAQVYLRRFKFNQYQFSTWMCNQEDLKIVVDKSDLGNINLLGFYVLHNRLYQVSDKLLVPWEDKNLSIKYSSFRDKTKPGSDEKYTLTIGGLKEREGQFLASMYDASLDAFFPHTWSKIVFPNASIYNRNQSNCFGVSTSIQSSPYNNYYFHASFSSFFPNLKFHENWLYPQFGDQAEAVMVRGASPRMKKAGAMSDLSIEAETTSQSNDQKENIEVAQSEIQEELEKTPPLRKNLNETVFFYPNLTTNDDGEISFEFKMNEAITEWKLMSFVHTKDLASGVDERTVKTQKELLIVPNMPRFLRSGDQINFSAKLSNLTDLSLPTNCIVKILHAVDKTDLTSQFIEGETNKQIFLKGKESTSVNWNLVVPNDFTEPVTIKVLAESGEFQDGEQNNLAILTNRKLVTVAKSFFAKGMEAKEIKFQHFIDQASSESLEHHKYLVELTNNPIWFAIKALPYIHQTTNESTSHLAERLYANSLAHHLVKTNPKIQVIFEQWKNNPEALKGELQKNLDLKEALIEATPWVVEGQSEASQRRDIALLFDLNKMNFEHKEVLRKIRKRQSNSGGFSWMPGGRDNWSTTQMILEQLVRLKSLGLVEAVEVDGMINAGLRYSESRLLEKFQRLGADQKKDTGGYNLSQVALHAYLNASYTQKDLFGNLDREAKEYWNQELKKHWLKQTIYLQALLGTAYHHINSETMSSLIETSLLERKIESRDLGTYWKNSASPFWYAQDIVQQSGLIEFFHHKGSHEDLIAQMQMWLLTNKQTNHWSSTKSTVAAIHSLTLDNAGLIVEASPVKITVGSQAIAFDHAEEGTGYSQSEISKEQINNESGIIKIDNPNEHLIWGAVYWQYWENLEDIKSAKENPFSIDKTIHKVMNSEKGEELVSLNEEHQLLQGDKLKVRIVLKTDRDLEYVQLRDMRGSGLENIKVLSQYKYQDGLGYYESPRDLYTDYFFSSMRKGTYVFEYELRVTHKGNYSNGITTAQCLYAPSFSSSSEGIRVKID